MSNFHHPRALIDLNQRDHDQADSNALVAHLIGGDDDDEEKQKEVKNKDTILLEIEKIFEVLLSIDEIEHSILKAPEEMRILLFQERRAKVIFDFYLLLAIIEVPWKLCDMNIMFISQNPPKKHLFW